MPLDPQPTGVAATGGKWGFLIDLGLLAASNIYAMNDLDTLMHTIGNAAITSLLVGRTLLFFRNQFKKRTKK